MEIASALVRSCAGRGCIDDCDEDRHVDAPDAAASDGWPEVGLVALGEGAQEFAEPLVDPFEVR